MIISGSAIALPRTDSLKRASKNEKSIALPYIDSTSAEQADKGSTNAGPSKPVALRRVLKLYDLIAYGVGSTVGAGQCFHWHALVLNLTPGTKGVYSIIAVAVALSGPSVVISFLICCLACVCTGLVYAEFAVRIPQAGSAYTFAYTRLV